MIVALREWEVAKPLCAFDRRGPPTAERGIPTGCQAETQQS